MERPVAVGSRMTRFPIVVEKEMPLAKAMSIMGEFEIRHLPVVEAGTVVGTISERDILRASATMADAVVADAMQTDVFVAAPGAPLSEVTRVMYEKKLGSVVIVDPACNVTGIFTSTDALRLLAEYFSSAAGQELEISMERYFDWDPGLGESLLGNPACRYA